MGAVRVRVADAIDNGDLALVPQPLDRRHVRIQPDIAVKIQQLVELKLHRWAEIVVNARH